MFRILSRFVGLSRQNILNSIKRIEILKLKQSTLLSDLCIKSEFNGSFLPKIYLSKNQYNQKQEKSFKSFQFLAMLLCVPILNKYHCEQKTEQQQFEVQLVQVDKVQLVNLVHSKQECLIMAFNKYQKNNQKEFAKQISIIYQACKQAKVKNIYLVDKNDIKQLEKFAKWLKQEKQENLQNSKDRKSQFFYLNPQFESFPFFIQSIKTMEEQIKQIKSFEVKFNPSTAEYLQQSQIFNRTAIIKQCPTFIINTSQNPCVSSFKRQISQIIQMSLLRKKQQQFKFYVMTPTSTNKLQIQNFHSQFKSHLQKKLTSAQTSAQIQFTSNFQLNSLNDKKEDTFSLRNDPLGKNIQLMSEWVKYNKNQGKNYKNEEKFMHFIKPRVFIISKTNYKTDLYWYVTCNRKYTNPTISIRNIEQMKTFYTRINHKIRKDQSNHPLNYDLQMLKALHKNHPNLNYLVINTSIVAELIRHLWQQNKFVIFNLSSSIPYQKLYLPNINYELSIQENYQKLKPFIDKFMDSPKIYNTVVMDKEQEIGREELLKIMKDRSENIILRVCYNKCLESVNFNNERKMEILKMLYPQRPVSEQIKKQSSQLQTISKRQFNKIYEKSYWIDSQINNVGLQDGNYLYTFKDGSFTQI